jgi:hypothetical protein
MVAVALSSPAACGCTSGIPHCAPVVEVAPPPAPEVDYALVELRSGSEQGTQPYVEITPTDAYRRDHMNFKSAAIRLPDSCLATTSAGASGISSQAQNILSTQCGVWLQELERALTEAKFKVYSWDALLGLERQKNLSPYEAGRQLGADVVFVFNSLDASPVQAGAQSKTSFKYFKSDAKGHRGSPLSLDDATRSQFREFAKANSGADLTAGGGITALSCTLNSTAIVTGGNNPGESIWFYKRTVTIPVRRGAGRRFLFGRAAGGPWTPAEPDLPKVIAVTPTPQTSSEDVVESQTSASKENAYAAERDDLIHKAAADFVEKFQTGGK